MKRASDQSKRIRHVLAPLLGSALIAYFAYHMVQGDRGLLAWWQLRYQIEAADQDLARVTDERAQLTHRISLMRPESLDLDMLDEETRDVLALARPNELLIIQN
jgi:cell division protein FtsB